MINYIKDSIIPVFEILLYNYLDKEIISYFILVCKD